MILNIYIIIKLNKYVNYHIIHIFSLKVAFTKPEYINPDSPILVELEESIKGQGGRIYQTDPEHLRKIQS